MPASDYPSFFAAATGHSPYAYQSRLAADSCESRLIQIPTGLGKTAAVVLAWLWNRVGKDEATSRKEEMWPRRLVYCLPMRTLVEQTADVTRHWVEVLAQQGLIPTTHTKGKPRIVVLMGGESPEGDDKDWDIYPEQNALLIGTQDMLLSRALNRGYGMSRYRWPMHFGLLNNDCLWAHDETQLMSVGLESSLQLAGFRERFGMLAPCVHWWMSATLDESRLKTTEAPSRPVPLQLCDLENRMPEILRRLEASKRLHRATTHFASDTEEYGKDLAAEMMRHHVPSTLSVVIINTVERAQAVFRQLRKQSPTFPVTLLHSRFRPFERQALVRRVLDSAGDHIVVSTQVIEAGVDISARTLITELAPWSSLVQRFGRCHRHGEMSGTGADIHWIDVPDTNASPYLPEELSAARNLLSSLTDVSSASLCAVTAPPSIQTPRHIIRPKDLRELFDTTPDIAGADLDISRYIREAEDSDCLVFWRAEEPDTEANRPAHHELCPVPVGQLRVLAKKQKDNAVWVWDSLAGQWNHPERFIPGRTYWLLASLGGYDTALGFDHRSKGGVPPTLQPGLPPEAHDDERGTTREQVETLEQHTSAVVVHTTEIAAALDLPEDLRNALTTAARWHDVGKAHPVFQAAMRRANPELDNAVLYAKSGTNTRLIFEGRPHFRHELASALAYRTLAARSSAHGPLVAYLIAAHHGKVRLSIRSLPGESEPPRPPDGSDPLFARGVWHGDTLPAFNLGDAECPAVTLSLAPIQIGVGPEGEPSWLEHCLAMRDAPELGPFRLSFLETLLRAADMRASATKPQP